MGILGNVVQGAWSIFGAVPHRLQSIGPMDLRCDQGHSVNFDSRQGTVFLA